MFIDIHCHAYRLPAPQWSDKGFFSFCSPLEVLRRYDQIGIERGVLLPLVGPEVYIPQSNEDILEMAQKWPDRFIPFCNVDPRALTNSPDAPLGDLLRYYRDKGCKGIGELMPNLPFLDPLVQNLFKHAEEVGLPVLFDISERIGGRYGLYDEPGLPQLETCLRRFPRLQIIGHGPAFWAEIGRLETPADRGGYPSCPIREGGVAPKLFRRYPNLWGDLSANSGYNALVRDRAYAPKFLMEFQDRLLYGTDLCFEGQKLPLAEFLLDLRDRGEISSEAFRKIARENAICLLGLSA